jgi:predicted RNA-binding Zn ribbon-like protein
VRAVVEDRVWRRERAAPQPGGRPPAPGQLALFQAFLNSHFDLVEHWGVDLLADPVGLRSWLVSRNLIGRRDPVREVDVARVLTVREGFRQLIAAAAGTGAPPEPDRRARLDHALAGASFELRMSEAGPRLVPAGAGALDRALAVLLSIATRSMLEGSWSRLKTCPGRHCGWVFYDLSRNNSGRWCSMTVCGGREKSRAHYRRHRDRGE